MIVDEDLTEQDIVDSITSSLAEELNIHPSNVEVSYDPETGVVIYTIKNDDIDTLEDSVRTMQESGFEDSLPLNVQSYEAPESIVVSVDVTVDASNILDVDAAINSVTNTLQEQDATYDIVSEGKFS